MMNVKSGQCSIRPRAIFDDDWLAEQGTEFIGDDAANRVAAAAWTEHVNQGDRPRRIIVGRKCRAEQCCYGGDENEGELFHGIIAPLAVANL
jgi:hypothetical protein